MILLGGVVNPSVTASPRQLPLHKGAFKRPPLMHEVITTFSDLEALILSNLPHFYCNYVNLIMQLIIHSPSGRPQNHSVKKIYISLVYKLKIL